MSEVRHCRSETPSFRFIHALSVLIEDNELHLQGALICKWNPTQGTIHQVPILAIKTNIVMAIHKWMVVFNMIYNDANTDWNRAIMNGRIFNRSFKSDYFWALHWWKYIWCYVLCLCVCVSVSLISFLRLPSVFIFKYITDSCIMI